MLPRVDGKLSASCAWASGARENVFRTRARAVLYLASRVRYPRPARSLGIAPVPESISLRAEKFAMVQDTLAEADNAAPHDPEDETAPDDFLLGVEGFTYGDLYRPERLRALAEAFYAEVEKLDASLSTSLADYVASRGEKIKGT